MTYNNYLQTAQSIFDGFPNEQIWAQGGFQVNHQLQKPEAGYCVVLRYDEKVTSVIAQFMKKIHAVLPGPLTYNEENLHSTIGTFGKMDMNAFVPDPTIIRYLAESVEKGISGCSRNIGIDFGKWLYNEEAILVSGHPNQALWHLCLNIENTLQENNLPIAMGRIMHITTARFTGSVSFQAFEQFRGIMKSAPVLGSAKPIAIDLATWSCDGLNFKLHIHTHFSL
jgi:hypothetical protein